MPMTLWPPQLPHNGPPFYTSSYHIEWVIFPLPSRGMYSAVANVTTPYDGLRCANHEFGNLSLMRRLSLGAMTHMKPPYLYLRPCHRSSIKAGTKSGDMCTRIKWAPRARFFPFGLVECPRVEWAENAKMQICSKGHATQLSSVVRWRSKKK